MQWSCAKRAKRVAKDIARTGFVCRSYWRLKRRDYEYEGLECVLGM